MDYIGTTFYHIYIYQHIHQDSLYFHYDYNLLVYYILVSELINWVYISLLSSYLIWHLSLMLELYFPDRQKELMSLIFASIFSENFH